MPLLSCSEAKFSADCSSCSALQINPQCVSQSAIFNLFRLFRLTATSAPTDRCAGSSPASAAQSVPRRPTSGRTVACTWRLPPPKCNRSAPAQSSFWPASRCARGRAGSRQANREHGTSSRRRCSSTSYCRRNCVVRRWHLDCR